MKSFFPTFFGNESLRSALGEEILSDRLGHAYILEGPLGTGKHTLAFQIAAALACEQKTEDGVPLPCMQCPSCRKILSGNSPDVIFVGREDGKATIGVDTIRETRNFSYMAPNELEDKIYIFEDAQAMTPAAQNALLLILEEPPAYLRFFLLTDGSIPLLETIRSRAPTLRLTRLSKPLLQEKLLETEPEARALQAQSPTEFRELIAAADGSMGRAKKMLDPKFRQSVLEDRRMARSFAELAASRSKASTAIPFLNGFGSRREEVINRLLMILLCIRDLSLLKQSETAPLCFFDDREEATDLAFRFTAPELMRYSREISSAMDALYRNANIRLVLTRFAMHTGLLS
ncbi:MAG: hypothetical protein E7680_07365 [Ruminococcaceae bacterium]|nr:hypothetical protein [Oscillospiraceae bacterium]